MFNIAAIQYNLRERALEIYISGCIGENGRHCKNCHNPSLWDSDMGFSYFFMKEQIISRLQNASEMILSFRIYGGEPLEKPLEELVEFLNWLKIYKKEIWLFTRFTFDKVPKEILDLVDYIKCGSYIEELAKPTLFYGVTLSTSNQRIYKKGVDYG